MEKQGESSQAHSQSPVILIRLPGISISLKGSWLVIAFIIFVALALAAIMLLNARTDPGLWISAVLWIVFIAYWNIAASNTAPTVSSESAASRQLHLLLLYGALALAFLPVPGLDQRWLLVALWIKVAIGLSVQVVSVLLAVWARRHLGQNWSGAITTKAGHRLIRSGPYRLIRHPIYTAILGMFLGTAIVSGEVHGLLAVAVMATAYWRKIRLEEQHLRGIFGAEYDDYRKSSRAVIPWLL